MWKRKVKECELCLTDRVPECSRKAWEGRGQVWNGGWGLKSTGRDGHMYLGRAFLKTEMWWHLIV